MDLDLDICNNDGDTDINYSGHYSLKQVASLSRLFLAFLIASTGLAGT